jgi:hypothetical protein
MQKDRAQLVGFAHYTEHDAPSTRRPVVELIATATLALSTVIAVTAVSIGIARADVPGTESDSTLAVALLIGLLLSGMGGLTAVMAKRERD